MADEGREGVAEDGVFGADTTSAEPRFERGRRGGFFGGPSVRSIAVAGLAGGGPGEGTFGIRELDMPGDAV